MQRGKFVVFEGLDGSGKDTQLDFLREKLPKEKNFFTLEPGGGPQISLLIRQLLMRGDLEEIPACDLLLFWASRAAHIEDYVEPALHNGINVISNRYESSSWAFQICGEERRELAKLFHALRRNLPGMIFPDAYLIVDLPAEVAYARTKQRAENAGRRAEDAQSRFDIKPVEYHQRVRDGFREFGQMAQANGSQVFFVDGNQPKELVHAEVWKCLEPILG